MQEIESIEINSWGENTSSNDVVKVREVEAITWGS
jgi:hypothetical protein